MRKIHKNPRLKKGNQGAPVTIPKPAPFGKITSILIPYCHPKKKHRFSNSIRTIEVNMNTASHGKPFLQHICNNTHKLLRRMQEKNHEKKKKTPLRQTVKWDSLKI